MCGPAGSRSRQPLVVVRRCETYLGPALEALVDAAHDLREAEREELALEVSLREAVAGAALGLEDEDREQARERLLVQDRQVRPRVRPGLNIRSTRIIDTSYYFGLVLGCIDGDLFK